MLSLAAGCSSRSHLTLNYMLQGFAPNLVERVETIITVDPADKRAFYAVEPYHEVAPGIGYEVGAFNGSTSLSLALYHDESLGWVPAAKFGFTLLPPTGEAAPLLDLQASAYDDTSGLLGRTAVVKGSFSSSGSVVLTLTDQRCGGKTVCGSDQLCCDGVCVNPSSDLSHCGSCTALCGKNADDCAGGSCTCAGGSACSNNQVCCAQHGCFDLTSDVNNCGGCGVQCNPGESCVGSVCVCNSASPSPVACAQGEACCPSGGCSAAGCSCGAGSCGAPNTCCDPASGLCVDLQDSDDHCGACGTSCATPLHCTGGACSCNGQVCSPGNACCTGGANPGCADLTSSTVNCGTCDNACVLNEQCAAGVCRCGSANGPTCATGQICCGSQCVNANTDFMNCGACGNQCHPNEMCDGTGHCVCAGTTPARACLSSELCCPGVAGSTGGGCFSKTDNNHCGSCSTACRSSQQCENSGGTIQCVDTGCQPACSHGDSCVNDQCVCGTGTCPPPSPSATADYQCCYASCVDLDSDLKNCGSCGSAGPLCCSGVPTQHTSANCASCGNMCKSTEECCQTGNNVWACVADSDPNNCGGCGNACPAGPPKSGAVGGYQCCTCLLGGYGSACLAGGGSCGLAALCL